MIMDAWIAIVIALVVGFVAGRVTAGDRERPDPARAARLSSQLASNVRAEAVLLLRAGKKIDAIKTIRAGSGHGLKDAKGIAEHIQANEARYE